MKILIADDDPIIRQVLMNLLSKWGYSVVPTTNGAEAWEVLQNDSSLRIGLFDWFMPEINGMELTRRIRDANIAPFYIMLVTARGGKDSLLDALEAGADDFVSKPFDRNELHVRLRAGERIIKLEQALKEQNQALRDAQAALNSSVGRSES